MARRPGKTKFQLVMLNRQHAILKDLSDRAKCSPGILAGDIVENFRDQFMKIKSEYGMQFVHGQDPAIIQMLFMKNAGRISSEQFDIFMQGIRPKA